MSKSPAEFAPLLAFGAHPDDIEFGCGGIVALEATAGRPVHFVVCSRGEAGTNGTPEERTVEAENAARISGVALAFLELDGDARLEIKTTHTLKLAAMIRKIKPGIVLAPSLVENQHPDHARLGRMVRDAARLARYGGLAELRELPPHGVGQLFYYAVTPEAEPRDITPLIIDVSSPEIVQKWTDAMRAHGSQLRTRDYVELQLLRARSLGARAGLSHAIALYPNDPVVLESLEPVSRGARRF
ncbi:MAG TPA: PIG-L family deacetylase [Verrucomicrobiae bacterium]|nr:PIG-L family deacetylase [Verrucomicrobiae bacterium]